jgi:amino acid adenylation domain-containing protein
MVIQELLDRLAHHQIQLRLDGQRLCLEGNLDSSSDLMAELRFYETDIVAFLTRRPSTLTASADSERSEEFPLSFAQERIWFLDQLVPGSNAYNISAAYRLQGALCYPALEWSVNQIIGKHSALRTTIVIREGRPVQHVSQFILSPLLMEDLTHSTNPRQIALARLQTEHERPFDLATGPLFRVKLLALGPDDHVLACCLHHIIFDGWSLRVFCRQLSKLYASHVSGQSCTLEPFMQYTEYVRRQRQQLHGKLQDDQLCYWKRQLEGAPGLLELPADRPRPSVPTFRGRDASLQLPQALVRGLKTVSQSARATVFMTLLTLLKIMLHRLTGQNDIIVGAPSATRNSIETEEMIGLCLNNLVIRTCFEKGLTFSDLLVKVRNITLEAYAHQELPFEKLVEELHPDRQLGRTPVFQVFLNVVPQGDDGLHFPGVIAERITPPTVGDSKFDLTLYAHEESGEIQLRLAYNSDLFDDGRMQEFLVQFYHLAEQVVVAPHQPIDSYSLVTPRFKSLLPNPALPLAEPKFDPIVVAFDRWAERAPGHPAICWKGQTWTFSQLRDTSRAIASRMKTAGLKPGDVVGLTGSPSYKLVASMLGTLRAGGVMLPLDCNLPIARQRLMMAEARTKFVIRAGNMASEDAWLGELSDCTVVQLDAEDDSANGISEAITHVGDETEVNGEDPAYIFFTSGTTGIPKAVLGCHKGLSHFLNWQRTAFKVGPHDRCSQLVGLSFDAVLRDIFLPLTSGATLCLPDVDREDPEALLSWIKREGITLVHSVPAIAQNWIGQVRKTIDLPALRLLFFAGEPLSDALVGRCREAFPGKYEIVNLYGPTETTLVKCFHVVPEPPLAGIQPIGRPLPETQAWVLNEGGHLCGLGEIGEIVLRTPFRTLGYANSPDETGRRFRKNPFRQDDRDLVYFTGDLGRYRLDGSVDILGRIDHQVKIRGVRIELDEIASIISRHPEVSSSVVVLRKDTEPQVLVAYVVLRNLALDFREEVRAYLTHHLPAVMIPRSFVFLERIPVTTNGKVDRQALPPPEPVDNGTRWPHVAPRSTIEAKLTRIWSEVLGIGDISVFDNFFDLGGQSLLATRVVSRIRHDLNLECSLRLMFETPNLAALSAILAEFHK